VVFLGISKSGNAQFQVAVYSQVLIGSTANQRRQVEVFQAIKRAHGVTLGR
jgi:hypothetical protein